MAYSTAPYRFAYSMARGTIGMFCPIRIYGRENLPEGPAVLYANHSHWTDPFLMIFAMGKWDQVCMMAKAELFKIPFFAAIYRAIGMFSVKRGTGDFSAIDSAVGYLKEGRKVGIFPEGTRTKTDGSVRPKGGFLRIAEIAKVPLVPVYVERARSLFKPTRIVFGKPLFSDGLRDEETGKINYPKAARDLMQKIWDMKTGLTEIR